MTVIKLIETPDFHYVDQGDAEPSFEPDITDIDVECSLCHAGIGWVEWVGEDDYGRETEGHRWKEYYEVAAEYPTGPPDVPSKLCEDCLDWVATVGPDVKDYVGQTNADLVRAAAAAIGGQVEKQQGLKQ